MVCTFENTKHGKVIVEKQTDPTPRPRASPSTPGPGWARPTSPTSTSPTARPRPTTSNRAPYSVEELAKANWDLTSIVCVENKTNDSSGSPGTRIASFNVQAGETVTCTFNNRQDGKVIVEKQTDPDDSSASFAFDPGAGLGAANEPNFNLTDGQTKSYYVDPGTYSVEELAKANWDLTSINCVEDKTSNSSGSVGTRHRELQRQAGETVTCTFNNRQDGKVIVEKQTDPDNSSESFEFDPGAGLGAPTSPTSTSATGGRRPMTSTRAPTRSRSSRRRTGT